MNVGRAIRWFRQHRGISQGDVARRAACSISYLSLLENNKRDPTLSTVAKIADALHVPVGTLFLVAAEPSDLGFIDERLVDELRHAVVSSAPADRNEVAHG